ncbi:MAG: DUF1572 family protein [Planctomycetaceae bacterium]
MDDEPPPTSGLLKESIIDEQIHLLQAAMVKLTNCVQQLSDDQIWWRPVNDLNSVGNLILHVCGNLRQWVISGVGGEPDRRQREAEFSATGGQTSEALCQQLTDTLAAVASVLRVTTIEQLLSKRTIQGFEVTGHGAIVHSVSHFVGHTHQIIQLTRLQLGSDYAFAWSPESPTTDLPI